MNNQEFMKMFGPNDEKHVIKAIKEQVNKCNIIPIRFPIYNENAGIGLQFDVVGRFEVQTEIAKSLSESGYYYDMIAPGFYIFYNDKVPHTEWEALYGEAQSAIANSEF